MSDRGLGYQAQKSEYDDPDKKKWLEDRNQAHMRSSFRANIRANKAKRREFRQTANQKAREYDDDSTR